MLTLQKLWNESHALMIVCLLMLLALAASLAGLFLDARIVTGAPVWLKPAKFAISTLIFAVSMAWLFQYLTAFPRWKRGLAWAFSAALVLEVVIIDLQAARGVSSHFNVSTPLDGILFSIMGTGIAVLWLSMAVVAVLLFRQHFSNKSFGWALRLGMAITVLGAGAGGIMVRPTQQQQVMLEHHQNPSAIGAHTVGAPDGGPGLPATEWSAQHGDLRIPHFFGLHALQIIPFCAWLVIRRRKQPSRRETRFVFGLAASYLTFIAILTWQALRGQSIVEPDAATLTAFALWLVATFALWATSYRAVTVKERS